MSVDTKRLRELAEAATPGEWKQQRFPYRNEIHGPEWPICTVNDDDERRPLIGPADDPTPMHGEADASFIAAANPQTVIALLDEVERLDAALDEEIAERDARLKQIDDIADVLGDEGEWTNLHDRGFAACQLASGAVAEVESLRDETKRLHQMLAVERATVEQVMVTQRSERALLEHQLAAMTKARDEACDIAERHAPLANVNAPTASGTLSRARIEELRKVGAR